MNLLKRLSFLLVLVVFTLSCGDDEGGIDTGLFASWTKVRTELRDCANPDDNSSTNEVCDSQVCEIITLTDDLRYTMVTTVRGQEQTETGQVQIGENQINFLPDNSTGSTLYGYTLSGNTLTLTNNTVICTEAFVYNK